MLLPDNIQALRTAIGTFIAGYQNSLPSEIQTEVMEALAEASCVPQFTRMSEALYAAVKSTGPDALTGDVRDAAAALAGQLANFVGSNFGTMSEDERGLKIYKAMRRELGETTTPSSATDPAVSEKFAPTPAEPAPV